MDGRVQEPVAAYCRSRFRTRYVDAVTEAGPNLILTSGEVPETVRSILSRVALSVDKHRSAGIAVAGHHDCAANPSPAEDQMASLREAAAFLHESFSGVEVIALWVDEKWRVREVCAFSPAV